MWSRILVNTAIATALAMAFAACGGGGGSPTSPSGDDGPVAATIVIDATGTVTPKDVAVPVGSRVTFTNNHSSAHDMNSDPHPAHTLCTSLNVGLISAGQSRTSRNLDTARVCTYHDHINETNTALTGTIRVQ
ncbi:MAG: cupredoxin domain-containing protein [Vicinamibacterales bacterium]